MIISNIEVSYIKHAGSDLDVVNAARVSFDKESFMEEVLWRDPPTGETIESARTKGLPIREIFKLSLSPADEKLIKYLAKHKHFSPFNHSFLTMKIKAPIFVARQLVKHKFMPWNEISRRYVDEEPEFYVPREYRAKAENVKQGSSDDTVERVDVDVSPYDVVFTTTAMGLGAYQDLLNAGVAPEMARMVLPQNMMTEWWWSGTLGAYCDMLRLRLDPHTQAESRIVAQKVYQIVKQHFPISVDALLEITH